MPRTLTRIFAGGPAFLPTAVGFAILASTAQSAQAAVIEAWVQRCNNVEGHTNGRARAVAVDGSGNVVVTGYSFHGTNTDYYTAKYAATDGALLWERRYNGQADSGDFAVAVAVDASGNAIVTGFSNSNFFHAVYYTAKYAAADGALLWEQRYDGPASGRNEASAAAVDSSGNAVVTGYSSNGTNSDFYTAKYAATDGALLWEKRYNGPANFTDGGVALAVDRSGNVVVTGYSYNGSNRNQNNSDYYTAKYAASDGALLWEQRYNGPADSYDSARMVAVDGSGNALVTGYSSNGTNSDFYTAKYAATDGALLWEKRYNGPANFADGAQSVAVDSSGNVFVTGTSDGGESREDYYTAKYAAADGTLLWEQRYKGPTNDLDFAVAVAVDGSGNAVVTGYSGNVQNFDYHTAKYAAADGALLWEKRYDGPANGIDYPSALAIAPNGSVVVTGTSSSDCATVVYREVLPAVSIELVPAGVHLRVFGESGGIYKIERASLVTGPWEILATPTASITGLVEYTDTDAPRGSAFYRTSTP